MRAKNEIDHIFSELYSVPNCLQKPYFKLKVQELLLFLCMPLVICTPILIGFAILIPYLCFKNLEKRSIVNRLRAEQKENQQKQVVLALLIHSELFDSGFR